MLGVQKETSQCWRHRNLTPRRRTRTQGPTPGRPPRTRGRPPRTRTPSRGIQTRGRPPRTRNRYTVDRVPTRFVQKYTLRSRPETTGAHEAVEGGTGHTRAQNDDDGDVVVTVRRSKTNPAGDRPDVRRVGTRRFGRRSRRRPGEPPGLRPPAPRPASSAHEAVEGRAGDAGDRREVTWSPCSRPALDRLRNDLGLVATAGVPLGENGDRTRRSAAVAN